MKIPRGVRSALLSVVILIVLFVLAGTAYTLFLGQSGPPPDKTTSKPAQAAYSAPKPVAPAPNAPVGVSVDSLLSPVSAGSNTSLQVKTTPTASCAVSVVYNGVASTDSGLAPKVADAYGIAGWTWTVGAAVPAGSWPITVTCSYNTKSGVVKTNLQVTPKK
jgi:hypothetical protein